MKRENLYIVLFILFIFLSACSSEKARRVVSDIQLKECEDLVFVLDDSTVASTDYIQFFQRNDSNLLAFTNDYDNSIVLYDYKSRKYIDRISYDKEGNNGIGSVFSFCYVNDDSIYHYHYNGLKLYRTNHDGKVLEKYPINVISNPSPDSLFIGPTVFPRTASPLTLVGNKMLMAGFMMGEVDGENDQNRPVMVCCDLATGKLGYSDSYPSIYHKGHWGGDFTYRNPYFTLSPQNEIILSFAADPHIRVHKVGETTYREYYAGVGDDYVIKPVENNVSSQWLPDEKRCSHYAENLSYGPILYDKYRNVYYRFACLPDFDIDVHKVPIRKPIEVVVLNEDFELIGKCLIKKELYWINQCFVGEDGLHIQVETENEDELRFKTFVYEK